MDFLENMKTPENKQLLTLFFIFIICLRYIYDENKDTYVYISLIFVYTFFCVVLYKLDFNFTPLDIENAHFSKVVL